MIEICQKSSSREKEKRNVSNVLGKVEEIKAQDEWKRKFQQQELHLVIERKM
jgi:hypothetical protein